MRKWAEVIKAWADGAVIQYRDTEFRTAVSYLWKDCHENITPPFCAKEYEFRVKPEVEVQYLSINSRTMQFGQLDANLKLSFENGKLIAAEVLS